MTLSCYTVAERTLASLRLLPSVLAACTIQKVGLLHVGKKGSPCRRNSTSPTCLTGWHPPKYVARAPGTSVVPCYSLFSRIQSFQPLGTIIPSSHSFLPFISADNHSKGMTTGEGSDGAGCLVAKLSHESGISTMDSYASVDGNFCELHPIGDYCPVRLSSDFTTKQKTAFSLSNKELCGPSILWTDGPPLSVPTFIRQCTATGQWSIFAIEGQFQKPMAYKMQEKSEADVTSMRSKWKEECPFCPGNEWKCPEPLYEVRSARGNVSCWKIRVVPNKFCFLRNVPQVVCGFWGHHLQVTGTGLQEVIILSPIHNTCPALMSKEQLHACVEVLQMRGRAAAADPRILYVALFQNHGIKSGGSLDHPHFQVVGLPVVPTNVLQRMEHSSQFYKTNNECVFCRILKDELYDLEGDGTRIVCQNRHFVAFVPYAATRAFQIWIMPRRHSSNFLEVESSDELQALSECLHSCLHMIYHGLGDPDYNIVVRTAPPSLDEKKREKLEFVSNVQTTWDESYHWYVEVSPHTSEWGGISCFDMVVHRMLPETMAEQLIRAKILDDTTGEDENM